MRRASRRRRRRYAGLPRRSAASSAPPRTPDVGAPTAQTVHQSGNVERLSAATWTGTAAVFAAALLVRGLYLRQIWDAPFFRLRLGDAQAYHVWAQRIAGGDWLGAGVFYQAPLYPYFLGLIYRMFGEDPATIRIVQIMLGSAAC